MGKKTKGAGDKYEFQIKWEGPEALRPLLRPIVEYRLDPRNDRKHSDRNIMVVKNSLRELGQHRLAVEQADGTLQIGHAMIIAAQELGWTHMAGINSGDEGARARLRAIVDNRSGDESVGSEWDFKNLADDLSDLDAGVFDLEDFGFNKDELERIATWESEERDGEGASGPRVVITCQDKDEQQMVYDKLVEEGFTCEKKGG